MQRTPSPGRTSLATEVHLCPPPIHKEASTQTLTHICLGTGGVPWASEGLCPETSSSLFCSALLLQSSWATPSTDMRMLFSSSPLCPPHNQSSRSVGIIANICETCNLLLLSLPKPGICHFPLAVCYSVTFPHHSPISAYDFSLPTQGLACSTMGESLCFALYKSSTFILCLSPAPNTPLSWPLCI